MIRIRNESNMQIIIGKAGQVSLWVIIAIAIVAIVGLLALLRQKPLPEIDNIESPERTIESCARDAIYETVKLMAPQGGFVSPRNYKKYDNINVAYLCENIGYFETCINQHPSLLAEIKEEIYNNSINKKMTLSSKEGTKNIEDFNFEIRHPLYELALVANEIASQEAKYCYFEYVGYMILYPEFDIKKTALSDSTKIYTILHKDSNSEMNIAIRSCAIPPGI